MPFGELLGESRSRRDLADFRRDEMKADDIRGFVAGLSGELVLIEVVGDDLRSDGHRIIKLDDLTFVRWGTGQMRAWERAFEAREPGEVPADALDLTDWRSASASLQATGRLVTFHRERMDRSTVYIARDFDLTFDLVVGTQISTEGEEDGSFAIRFEDITRIDFGGGYERGLERVLGLR